MARLGLVPTNPPRVVFGLIFFPWNVPPGTRLFQSQISLRHVPSIIRVFPITREAEGSSTEDDVSFAGFSDDLVSESEAGYHGSQVWP